MPTIDDTALAIADSYARALLELSEQQGESREVLSELGDLLAAMEQDAAIADFLTSSALDDDARREGLEKVFRGKMSDLLLDTLQVLNAKGRSALLPVVYDRYRVALERVWGEVEVEVASAHRLTPELRERLVGVLARRTGRRPQVIERIDPSLLGGLVVQIGDEKLDHSVVAQLRSLRQALTARASREIHAGKKYYEGADAQTA